MSGGKQEKDDRKYLLEILGDFYDLQDLKRINKGEKYLLKDGRMEYHIVVSSYSKEDVIYRFENAEERNVLLEELKERLEFHRKVIII